MSMATTPRTRSGVRGCAAKKSGRCHRKHRTAARHAPTSDMTEHHFSRTSPPDRQQIAHATADDEPRRPATMTEKAIRVEQCTWEQAIAILPANQLAAMQVAGEDQVVAGMP